MRAFATLLTTLFIAFTAAVPLTAQERPRPQGQNEQRPPQAQSQPSPGVLRLLPPDSVTEHQVTLASGPLAYTATAGTLALFDQSGEQSAAVFYTAYVAKGTDAGARPLTFVFNGGPGAASAYLNLGLVGPRILPLTIEGHSAATPQLVDNGESWLGFTDLVMIDPIGTGWSRTAKSDAEKNFHSIDSDASSIAKVIALYVNHNSRLASPKYLLGESYGGFRAAKVARALQREQSIVVSGIVMVSPLLEGSFVFGSDRYALDAALALPSYAAAELERKGAFSDKAIADAERFAMTDYLVTLSGKPPPGEQGRAFYDKVALITGMPAEFVESARGFIGGAANKMRRDGKSKLISRYDGRVTVDDPFPESRSTRGVDPILDGVTRAYGSAFVAYARDELGFKTEMTYNLLAPAHWDWGDGGRLGASIDDDLRVLLSTNSSFRLLIGHGYTDLVTPYGATRYVLDHLPVGSPERVALKLYRGGHMLYLDDASRRAFSEDARHFYDRGY